MPASKVTQPWFGNRRKPLKTGVSPEQTAEVIREALDGLPVGGSSVTLQPFVVPLSSYRELMDATGAVLDLLRRAVVGLSPAREGRMTALGIDPDDCPRFAPDDDFELGHCADMGRADVVIGPEGPKFIEFNVSGAFGGMVHFEMYHRAWQRINAIAGRPAFIGIDPFARLAQLVERTCADYGVPPSVAVVDNLSALDPETTPRLFDAQVDLLRGHGVNAEFIPLDGLLEGLGLPRALRHKVGICEYNEQDAREIGFDTGPGLAAQNAGFMMLPSQSAWLLHSKKVLALVSEGQPWMSGADRALADRYLPWTRVVSDRAVDWQGSTQNLPALLAAKQDRFVLKGATGWSGHEVFFGGRMSPDAWLELIEEGVKTGYYVAQEVVETSPYPVEVLEESGEVVRIAANSVISPFCIGGAPAGCFARFVSTPRPGVVSAMSHARQAILLAEA